MTGADSHGVEARGIGSVEIDPNTAITTTGRGGIGIFALTGGTVTANGITITTSGFLSPAGFNADGAAALGGTIDLKNSSIRTSGANADGLHVFDAHRSEEHTSELQSHSDLVCRLLLEKTKKRLIPFHSQGNTAH